jgi:hypothetical protein
MLNRPLQQLIWSGTFLLLLSLHVSCTNRDTIARVELNPTPAELAAQIPPLHSFDPSHSVASPFTLQIHGIETMERGGTCVSTSSALELVPPEGEYAWALYEFSTDSLPVLGLTVDVREMTGRAFLAIADYDRGCWTMIEWTEDEWSESNDFELSLSPAAISPASIVYLAVIAAAQDFVAIDSLSLTVDRPGWTLYTLEDTPGVGLDPDLFVQDGIPMLAYVVSSTTGAIKFARPAVPLPAEASQWVKMAVDFGEDGEMLGRPLAAASIGGKPAIVYFESEEFQIMYSRATVAEPASSGNWISHTACPSAGRFQKQIGLTECLGGPRVSFEGSSDRPYLASSATAQPTQADWDIGPIAAADQPASNLPLAAIDNLPVLAIKNDRGEGKRLYVAYALVPTPLASANWEFVSVDTGGESGGGSSIAVQQIGEDLRPVVSYFVGTWDGPGFVARPLINTPVTPDDWMHVYLDHSVSDTSIAVADGRPFVIYFNADEGAVRTAWSNVAEFEHDTVFEVFTLDEDPASSTAYVATAAIGDIPIVAFHNSTSQQLRFGFYIEE